MPQAVANGQSTDEQLAGFRNALDKLVGLIEPFATKERDPNQLAETWDELTSVQGMLPADIKAFVVEVSTRATDWNESRNGVTRDNAALHLKREGLHNMAESCRDLTKQIDLAAKLAVRVVDIAEKELEAKGSDLWANTDIGQARRALEEKRHDAVESLWRARYFVRQADGLQERFPRPSCVMSKD